MPSDSTSIRRGWKPSPTCSARWCCRRRRTPRRRAGARCPELLKAAGLGRRVAGLDAEMRRELLDLFLKSAGDFLDGWFESDPIKAVYGFDGIVGTYASPYAAGTAYVLLHHAFGEVNGKRGVWGHAIGGMGAITQAMAKCCAARGVDDPHRLRAVQRSDRREGPRGRRRHRGRRDGPGAGSSSPTSTRSFSSRGSSTPRRCRRISCGASRTGVRGPARSA